MAIQANSLTTNRLSLYIIFSKSCTFLKQICYVCKNDTIWNIFNVKSLRSAKKISSS